MPTCAEASELPDPTDEVVLMPPLPPGELGNAVFKFFEVGRGDFRVGQVPALNKVIAYSLQGAWIKDKKPKSENFTKEAAECFFGRLMKSRGQEGYALRFVESIYATPEPRAHGSSSERGHAVLHQPHLRAAL